MLKAAFVRGAFLNNFEGQNFKMDPHSIDLRGFSSLYPIHADVSFPLTRLPSIADLSHLPILNAMPLYRQSIKYLSNRLIGDSQILFGLEKAVRGFDVVDTADPHYYYSYQLACMRKFQMIKQLIVTYCEIIPFNNESVARKKHIKYFTIQQADAFICHTELSKQALIAEGADQSKINLVRLGVDLERFKPKKTNLSRKLTILFVGRLVDEKGVYELYKAFRLIRNATEASILLKIVGDGSLRQTLESIIKKDGLQNVVSIEQVSYQHIHEVYQSADIFVLPSKRTKTIAEQYGMVLIEAMACGLPVIAAKTGAISEVLGDAGILVEDSDVEGLSGALLELINNSSLRKNLGKKSLSRSRQYFDSSKTARTIGTIYTRV